MAPDGNVRYRRGQFLPLAGGADESAPILAVLELADCKPQAEPGDANADALLHEQVRQFRQQMAGRLCRRPADRRRSANRPRPAQIALAAQTDQHVLVVGPRGSGKDHAAKAIHYSQAEPGLLVPLDCAVLEANVLRSALRTLSARREIRPPRSTLHLEHLDSLPREVQDELSELLGGGQLGLRIVATTIRPPRDLIADGRLRPELVCALSTLVIELPPLAQRIDDLPLLAQAILEQLNATHLRQLATLTPETLDQLAAYPWPGNLDELAEVVRHVHQHAKTPEVTPRDLPKHIRWGAEAASQAPRGDDAIVLEEFLGRVERELIARAMRRAQQQEQGRQVAGTHASPALSPVGAIGARGTQGPRPGGQPLTSARARLPGCLSKRKATPTMRTGRHDVA